jgi:hypothetical protein
MRWLVVLVGVAACGEDIDAPDDCAADELHIVHGAVDERVSIANHSFINKLSDASPGTLDIGGTTMTVHIEFDELAANGDTVDARGRVMLNGIDVGNCDADGFPSLLHVDDSVWRFELRDVASAPYCGGSSAPALRGCYRAN